MTENERIEKEAENIVNMHYQNKLMSQTEKEAEAYADSIDIRGCAFWRGMYRGYIAGAASEHDLVQRELTQLKQFVKEVDDSLYAGEDLKDEEILQHYISVFTLLKEQARKLIDTVTPT